MKIGFVSAILDKSDFEEMISVASDLGYKCVEVACWPKGKAERRYAGVSHIDVENNDDSYVSYIQNFCKDKGVEISSLAYYPNPLDQTKTVEENLELVKEVWPPIIKLAEECGVKVAIENCPMLFGPDQWPGGQNLMTTPSIWKKVFDILPSDNLGINYDPSHFVWQMIDYIKPIYEFKDKIFHVHFKDIKLYRDKLDQVGVMAYPLEYMSPKIPGYGDVDWGKYVSALTDIGYDGYTCIEVEDKYFEGSKEKVIDSLKLSKQYMTNFVI